MFAYVFFHYSPSGSELFFHFFNTRHGRCYFKCDISDSPIINVGAHPEVMVASPDLTEQPASVATVAVVSLPTRVVVGDESQGKLPTASHLGEKEQGAPWLIESPTTVSTCSLLL